jgi:hypothetical protein
LITLYLLGELSFGKSEFRRLSNDVMMTNGSFRVAKLPSGKDINGPINADLEAHRRTPADRARSLVVMLNAGCSSKGKSRPTIRRAACSFLPYGPG